jgi:hypothetical protein
MPTIQQILASRAAQKAGGAPAPAAPRETLAERAATKEAIDRIDPPGKRERAPARGLVLNKDMPVPPRENRGQATPVTGPENRALGATNGELIDMTPANADPAKTAWHKALVSLETELCLVRDPSDPERAWLAIRLTDQRPLLIKDFLIYDHPDTARPVSDPF